MTTAIILNTGATEMEISDYLENNEIVLVISTNNEWIVYFKLSTQKCRTKIFNGFYPIEKPKPENIKNAKPKVLTFNADYSELLICLEGNNVFCDDSQYKEKNEEKGEKDNMQLVETKTNTAKSAPAVITELLKGMTDDSVIQSKKNLKDWEPTEKEIELAEDVLKESFKKRYSGPSWIDIPDLECPDWKK